MKIVCWNINFAGDKLVHPAPLIKNYIQGHDVIVFTEAILNEYLIRIFDENEYTVFSSKKEKGEYSNQVVIAVKKEFSSSLINDELPNTLSKKKKT